MHEVLRPAPRVEPVVTWRELQHPSPELSTDSVRLRGWRGDDLDALQQAFSDQTVQQFSWPSLEPYARSDAQAFLRAQEQSRREGRELQLAITLTGDDTPLGGASLYGVDLDQQRAAIGYWRAPAARGRGAASSSVRLLARWAFAELGLARLELTCAPDNLASQRVARRCGFVREGVLRSHLAFKGARRDSVMHSLLAHEA